MPFNKDGKRKPMMYGKKKPMMYGKKPMLTDLSGDGKVTKKDVMIGSCLLYTSPSPRD